MRALIFRISFLVTVSATAAVAQMQDIQISATRKKLDESKERAGGPITVITKEIVYKVTVQNRTFKDISEIEMKYMIFYEVPQPGSKDKPETAIHKGKEKLASIEANREEIFETTPLKLSTEELDGNYYYASGAASKSKDRVTGVWIRAYVGDKIVGEYINPSTVAKKNDWKE